MPKQRRCLPLVTLGFVPLLLVSSFATARPTADSHSRLALRPVEHIRHNATSPAPSPVPKCHTNLDPQLAKLRVPGSPPGL